jgi:3-hydroxy-9,10-secoandrosta-1,3,5(10)-triene-9,17-dione monooxygenase reductase component
MSESETQDVPFDSVQYRKVLGHFPTGVTIVTGWAGDIPAGFTIGSFTSVSLDPPLVGFLPQISSDTWQAMAPAGKFCVNILRDDQADLCWRFAKSGVGDDRFDNVTWTTSPTGCPLITGIGAWIDCVVEHTFELGDHFMVVGRVIDLDHHADPHTPLVFYKGSLGGFLAAD